MSAFARLSAVVADIIHALIRGAQNYEYAPQIHCISKRGIHSCALSRIRNRVYPISVTL
jgi:hypothetical protein